MEAKYVYNFLEGNKDMKSLLGGKAANLAEMINIGLPVPPGFTITTKACNDYYDSEEVIREDIVKEIENHLNDLEIKLNKKLGGDKDPLLDLEQYFQFQV